MRTPAKPVPPAIIAGKGMAPDLGVLVDAIARRLQRRDPRETDAMARSAIQWRLRWSGLRASDAKRAIRGGEQGMIGFLIALGGSPEKADEILCRTFGSDLANIVPIAFRGLIRHEDMGYSKIELRIGTLKLAIGYHSILSDSIGALAASIDDPKGHCLAEAVEARMDEMKMPRHVRDIVAGTGIFMKIAFLHAAGGPWTETFDTVGEIIRAAKAAKTGDGHVG